MQSDNTLTWLLMGGLAVFMLYKAGFGAWVGQCPAGYRVGSDMFPFCGDVRVYADTSESAGIEANRAAIAARGALPELPYPQTWGWDGRKYVKLKSARLGFSNMFGNLA